MGQKDIAEKVLEDYNDVFADIVNVLMFKGERRVAEDDLTEGAPRSAYKADGKYRELERDVVKRWTNSSIHIASIGLENQTAPDVDMPMRIIGYDAAEYSRELKAKKNDKEDEQDCNSKERYPVVSLILYFGYDHRWIGPRTLYEMIDIPDGMEEFVNDYRIHVFEIAWLDRDVIDTFESDFGIVADYFWQKRTNKDYVPSSTVIRHVQETLSMLSILTGDHQIEDVLNDPGMEGKESKSMESIWNQARKQGLQEGVFEGKADSIRNLMDSLKFTVDQAMDALKIPENERDHLRAML